MPVQRRPHDRVHMMEHMYLDRDMYEDQHPQRRGIYEEAKHLAYGRAPIPYITKKYVVGEVPPRVSASASTMSRHSLASMVLVRTAAHVKELQPSNVIEDVYSFESYNLQSSITRTTPNTEDIAQTVLSPMKGRHSVQYLYEKEEAKRIAQEQKPFRIECDNTCMPIERGGAA